ncbi:hypothetical protein PSJ8397_00590 [Pseudooctadecabacter jejudonensis]|uniref:Uncharacterized protein n=1 Tax=Pseudooctadecabacter jejudonensis TaxID=1391910 RepID=A0A1Y5RIH9_9RHOB|nr:hypothetical protein PSJ8397_00590 [Pseudooctadecabacter jejudonensis]
MPTQPTPSTPAKPAPPKGGTKRAPTTPKPVVFKDFASI